MNLNDWITRQIDATEHSVRGADKEHGRVWGTRWDRRTDSFQIIDDSGILVAADVLPGTAGHVTRHDPGAVLGRCAADRKILELHQPVACGAFGCDCDSKCESCDWTESQERGQEPSWGYPDSHVYPCPTVRAVAEGYGWEGP